MWEGILSVVGFCIVYIILRRLLWRGELGKGPIQKTFTVFFDSKTVQQGEPLVLFIIGARINDWTYVIKHPMLIFRYLFRAGVIFRRAAKVKSDGMLASMQYGGVLDLLFGGGLISIQYWKSVEALESFAKNTKEHRSGSSQYFAELEDSGAYSIFHETYIVREHENLYGSSRAFGLARVPGSTPIALDKGDAKENLKTLSQRLAYSKQFIQ